MARGADLLAFQYAQIRKIPTLPFHADWKRYGKAAGFQRNKQMLDEGKPELVLAFPGGAGTRMMCKIAEEAAVKVLHV